MDGVSAQFSADYDPKLRARLWCEPREAAEILLVTDEEGFTGFLQSERAQHAPAVRLAQAWPSLPLEERRAHLPLAERAIEREVRALMRAIFWSDPNAQTADLGGRRGKAFWRRPRLAVSPDDSIGTLIFDSPAHKARMEQLWAHVAPHFAASVAVDPFDLHPSAAHWMSCGGAYFVQLSHPTLHEHLEARLLLRDWLRARGVELDDLERTL